MAKKDDSYNFRKIFEEIELDLVKSMKRNLRRHEEDERKEGFKWEQWQKAKLRNLQKYKQENQKIVNGRAKKIGNQIKNSLKSGFKKGQNFFSRAVDKVIHWFSEKDSLQIPQNAADYLNTGEPKETAFFSINDKKLEVLQKTVTKDISNAQSAVLRKMDDVYRKTIYRAQMHMASGAKTLEQAIDLATKEFLQQGINCIQYKDGRLVNIASYAEMALRTANHRATLLGEGKKRDEWGIYTVIVSAHANTCPKCEPWQGKILIDDVFTSLSTSKAIELKQELGYPLLSEAIDAGLLHPNCRHSISTYFPGVTRLPEVPDGKEAIKKYNAEQKQRKLESDIRKYKRIAEGSLDAENMALALRKVKGYQAELRKHLKDNPYLRRNYAREKTRDVPLTNKAEAEKLRLQNQEYIDKYSQIRYNDDGTVKVTDDWKNKVHAAIPKKYKPNAIIETKSGKSNIDRTYYNQYGKLMKQIHSGPHSNPKNHPYGSNGEHAHDYKWIEDKIVERITRELEEYERKENGDIL